MLLERFTTYLNDNKLIRRGDTLVLAVSGGPDSLCLLDLFNRLAADYDLKLVVAHLNHRLRPEADLEEAGVAGFASRMGLIFESRTVDIKWYKKHLGLSEELAGRRARYRFLFSVARKYGANVIALGHHWDDQAETVLLNLLRGCGIDGLAGILPARVQDGIKLIRPLLSFRRIEIEAYLRENNYQPYTDSSNLEKEYKRNRVRLELIPYLEREFNPRVREALVGLAELAAADRRFLESLASKKAGQLAEGSDQLICVDSVALMKLAEALRGRVLRFLLRRFRTGKELGRLHIDLLLKLAGSGKRGSRLVLPGGIIALKDSGCLVLKKQNSIAEQRRLAAKELALPGSTILSGGNIIRSSIAEKGSLPWPPVISHAYLDFESLPVGRIFARSRLPGDRFYPQGAGGAKKLKDFLIDQKIERSLRDGLPIIAIGREIIWVAGVRIAHPYRVTGKTRKVLVLEYEERQEWPQSPAPVPAKGS